eukprot:3697001-Rhodomonas_salina.1
MWLLAIDSAAGRWYCEAGQADMRKHRSGPCMVDYEIKCQKSRAPYGLYQKWSCLYLISQWVAPGPVSALSSPCSRC